VKHSRNGFVVHFNGWSIFVLLPTDTAYAIGPSHSKHPALHPYAWVGRTSKLLFHLLVGACRPDSHTIGIPEEEVR
jgi:hypothetical protein